MHSPAPPLPYSEGEQPAGPDSAFSGPPRVESRPMFPTFFRPDFSLPSHLRR